jgi:uncharacterized membrane protein
MSANAAHPTVFEAMITPHRSLSARARRRIVIALFGASAASAAVFWLLGAWPVTGFCGAEIGLASTLLLLHSRSARASELVLLTDRTLRVVRTDPRGRRAVCELQAAWLHVRLEERNGTTPRLLVGQRDREVELARVLGEAEKRDLAAALSEALDRQRNPRFDNPQL